ncbi:hypothetical protein ACJ2A9_21220 [Anaerobacillus sp. MEB173]
MSVYYNFFLRQWNECRANEEDIDKAVERRYITVEQGEQIKNTERNCA